MSSYIEHCDWPSGLQASLTETGYRGRGCSQRHGKPEQRDCYLQSSDIQSTCCSTQSVLYSPCYVSKDSNFSQREHLNLFSSETLQLMLSTFTPTTISCSQRSTPPLSLTTPPPQRCVSAQKISQRIAMPTSKPTTTPESNYQFFPMRLD